MSLARLSVRNPVPVNLLMLAIISVGSLSLALLPREVASDISFNWVFIITPYPGVSAEEVEKLITVPIEEEIRDVRGVDSIASQSTEGQSFISVKFQQMSDDIFRARLQDLRAEVDQVEDLPEDAFDPIVQSFGSADLVPLISVHLYGQPGEKKMVELARELRDEIRVVPKLAKLELVGVRDREVWVEADPARLRGHSLSLAQLQAVIAARGVNVPAGKLDIGREVLLVRSIGELDRAEQIGEVIVHATPAGRTLRVRDVATVRETFEEARTRSRLDLEPVVSLAVTKQADGNSIAVCNDIKRIARQFAERQGGIVRVAFTQDSSELIADIISKLTNNAWLGFAIVVCVLMLVLGLRNAMLAALGIPLSFLACFIFMHHVGESFNGNSLFGLVLVLGIIVDDAIIIVENCYRHLQMGKSWKLAAIEGTEEVTGPILSATATTVAAFLPLVLLPGIVGKFMRIIPITVSLALAASMVEAFIILPSHFADWPGRRLVQRREQPWLRNLQDAYERLLRVVVRRRYLFVGGMLLLVPVAGALVPLVGVDMFAGEDINTFQVRVRMPTGTNLQATQATLRRFEEAAMQIPRTEVRAVHATAGLVMTDDEWIFRPDVGQVWLDLPLSYQRVRTADALMDEVRRLVEGIPGPVHVELAKINTGPPVGRPVEVKLKGKYLDALQRAAQDLQAFVANIEGVSEVDTDFRQGSKEVRVRVDPDRAALAGLSVAQLGMSLRAAIDGVDAGTLYDGDEQIDVVVRVDKSRFSRPEDLLGLPVVLPSGGTISLGEVAGLEVSPSFAEIRRFQNRRAITVSANLDKTVTDTVKVNSQIRAWFDAAGSRYAGITLDFGGEFQEFKEAFASLAQLFLIGLLLMYVILGAQFRSYVQPLVILFTVPFAFTGAVLGLVVSGNPFSVATLFGMVALAGVAVNDAIVLISFVNEAKARGVPAEEAVVEAGRLRLRPVILTSVTTVGGLLPMAMGLGGMSLTWGPLANTIVWGLMVATALTLCFIPAVYLVVVHDIVGRLRGRLGLQAEAEAGS